MNIDYTIDNAEHAAAEASRLLANDVFNDAYKELIADIESRLFSTDPEDRDEREQLYHLHLAAQLFVNNIASRINQHQLRQREQ